VRYAVQGQQRAEGVQERRRGGGPRERGKGQKKPLGLLVAGVLMSFPRAIAQDLSITPVPP
jgi:hypothetical protein